MEIMQFCLGVEDDQLVGAHFADYLVDISVDLSVAECGFYGF